MSNLLLSAFLGVLAGKVIDALQKSKRKQIGIYFFMGAVWLILALIYIHERESNDPSEIYKFIDDCISNLDSNILKQSFLLFFVLLV